MPRGHCSIEAYQRLYFLVLWPFPLILDWRRDLKIAKGFQKGLLENHHRASSALGSLSRAFGRAPKAFKHSAKIFNVFSRHLKGFLRLLKAPKGSQWSHPRASEASGELPQHSEAFQGLLECCWLASIERLARGLVAHSTI